MTGNTQNNEFHHALKVNLQVCIACSHCMRNCPTQAIRIHGGKAQIDSARCVDCGECYRVCPTGAIYVEQDDFNRIYQYRIKAVIVPLLFWGQFNERYKFDDILAAIQSLGFEYVIPDEYSVLLLKGFMTEYIEKNKEKKPLISTFCPAIVRLIQIRFPSLTEHLIPFHQPLDITAYYLKNFLLDKYQCDASEIGIFYITSCAAKIALIKDPTEKNTSIISGVLNMNSFYNKVQKIMVSSPNDLNYSVNNNTKIPPFAFSWSLTTGEKRNIPYQSAAVDGMDSVIEFLEQIEDERITGFEFLELRACDESCPGGILTVANKFIAVSRMQQYAQANATFFTETPIEFYINTLQQQALTPPFDPKDMHQIDSDPKTALLKLQKIEKKLSFLPGFDCGVCGAPTCKALAEDIVKHHANLSDCLFLQRAMEKYGILSPDRSIKIIEKIWGEKRFCPKNKV